MNAGIGTAYASAFKSTGIGLLNSIDSRHIPALLKALVPIPALSKALIYGVCLSQRFSGLATLYPHSLPGGLKRQGKKRRDRNFDPIPALFRAIPAVLKTLG